MSSVQLWNLLFKFALPTAALRGEEWNGETEKYMCEKGTVTHKWNCIWKWKGSRYTDQKKENYCEEGTVKSGGHLSSESIKVHLWKNQWAWIE